MATSGNLYKGRKFISSAGANFARLLGKMHHGAELEKILDQLLEVERECFQGGLLGGQSQGRLQIERGLGIRRPDTLRLVAKSVSDDDKQDSREGAE